MLTSPGNINEASSTEQIIYLSPRHGPCNNSNSWAPKYVLFAQRSSARLEVKCASSEACHYTIVHQTAD